MSRIWGLRSLVGGDLGFRGFSSGVLDVQSRFSSVGVRSGVRKQVLKSDCGLSE